MSRDGETRHLHLQNKNEPFSAHSLQEWVLEFKIFKSNLGVNVHHHAKCISVTNLLRQFYKLPHWNSWLSHPVTVYLNWPVSPGTDTITLGVWQGSCYSPHYLVRGMAGSGSNDPISHTCSGHPSSKEWRQLLEVKLGHIESVLTAGILVIL